MATSNLVYSVNQEITDFFEKTTATPSVCDSLARERLGGSIVPAAVQGACSYTVYAGPNAEFIVQFRLASLQIGMNVTNLTPSIYGQFAPQVTFLGQIGEGIENKEPLYIYFLSRVRGISYMDFILAHNSQVPENSSKFSLWRKDLVIDITKYD